MGVNPIYVSIVIKKSLQKVTRITRINCTVDSWDRIQYWNHTYQKKRLSSLISMFVNFIDNLFVTHEIISSSF